ncbi:hypothetical protein CDAR_542571 [Caerostris darwini]|uniref:Uncharacterized protein n=1 Tax=Caerostris darwini TaxID=1538125 RepID=A0AAV4RQ20_9ARAC|nr:hypothetical protein CDAR_542571 [Caerostris darwini]
MSFQKAVRVRRLATIMVFMERNCSQFELKGVVFEEGIRYDTCHLGCQNQSVPNTDNCLAVKIANLQWKSSESTQFGHDRYTDTS